MLSEKVTVASAFPPVLLCCVMVFVNVSSYPANTTLCVSSRSTDKGRIIRLNVVRLRRRTEDYSSTRILRLVPVFILETYNQTSNKCLPRFVQTDNGCLPFSQTIWKFSFRGQMERHFSENLFGNCGQPPGSPLFPFGAEFGKLPYLTICDSCSVSRPFLVIFGMECQVVNGKRHSHPVGQ